MKMAKHHLLVNIRHKTTTTIILWPFVQYYPGEEETHHPVTPILIINHPLTVSSIYYNPQHPPSLIYMPNTLFGTTSLQVLFGFPLGLEPSTPYSIHFFTQSLSSFHNTCPYHRNLFCCSTEIYLFLVSLNSLLGLYLFTLMSHIQLTILISAW